MKLAIGEEFQNVYYCLPNIPLSRGIHPIVDHLDFDQFIDSGYEYREISVYVDHNGNGLEEWWDDDMNLVVSEDNESGLEDNSVPRKEENNAPDETHPNVGLEDKVIDIDKVPLNKTTWDEFLSKLYPLEGDTGDNEVEEEDVEIHSIFNPDMQWKRQVPILGMKFESPKQLNNMFCNYDVANGYQLCFKKNDSKRLLVVCCKGACPFRLWATWMRQEVSFQIKSLKIEHNCARNYKLGSIVTYSWIGEHYTKEILHRQKLTIRQLRLEVIRKFGIQVSLTQCRRARVHAMNLIEGTLIEHYEKLWSYGEEIRRRKPGSTVKIDVQCMRDGLTYFSKFYVCFANVKSDWLEGCRKVLGIDGCFLKGACNGELLCVVGRDANNHIFPVAWGIVCVEIKENWMWFLELLRDDLKLGMGTGFTLMYDQHKGLMVAVKDVLPCVENRQCARHIVANFKKRLSPEAHKYLMEKELKTWSREFYEAGRACAAVENGISKSFNAVIVEAKRKPIITMLEELRLYIMERMFNLKHKK
ncbi:hypothetical protein Lser_V15G12744 [Lactuca serriola]